MDKSNNGITQELLNCLHNYLQQHSFTGKAYDLFNVLTDLTAERLEKREDLKIQSTALQASVYGKLKDNSPGSTLATPWKTLLEKILPERETGMQKYFAQNGFDQYLWPQKDKSTGGAGNTSIYYLMTRDILNNTEVSGNSNSIPIPTEGIRYIPEITPRASWWINPLLNKGYALQGWRRFAFIVLTMTSLLVVTLVLYSTFLTLLHPSTLSTQGITSLVFSTAATSLIGYLFLSPIFNLLRWRMIEAPVYLVSFRENNVLLELKSEQRKSGGNFKVLSLVRYAGNCTICKGKVEVVAGGKEFPNRFVGRCIECPAEHVFSFDRALLIGKLLR